MRPMEGIRILEVAQFTFVPAAGAVLADWGAEVIKVEHASTGDGQRGLRQIGRVRLDGPHNPAFEHPNRGKRSVGLDIATPGGREVLLDLVETCDVFLTNFLPDARVRLGIDVADIRERNPDVIYVRGSALGDLGPEREKGGYDMTGFWCRGSSAASITPPDSTGLIPQPPAYGDTLGGAVIAGGIAAALLAREKTGQTSEVDVSLLGLGMWAMGLPIAATLGREDPWIAPPTGLTAAPTNPTAGVYETSDGRLLSLMMLQGYRYWADFCRHIDRPDLISDVRFADAESLAENAGEAETILREVLAGRTLAEWTERFTTLEGQWAPVQNTHEVAADPQARANGYITEVSAGDGTFEVVASPVQFDHESPTLQAAPEFAADTEAVLLELGFEWDRIMELKVAGAIT